MPSTLLALDFDGVICNGLKEYFQSAWKAYCQIWNISDLVPPSTLAEQFYRLRPVVETGWEMPVVLRALNLGFTEADILQRWSAIATEVITQDKLAPLDLSKAVDSIRDTWIATDVDSWLAEHEFYPGVTQQMQELQEFLIISTKEGRFIKQLLQQQGIQLSDQQVYGKEVKRLKYEILRDLKTKYSDIWFVEDRLKTLQTVKQQSDLEDVMLFLADWGYNTASERQEAAIDDRIHLLSLEQFGQDFSSWL
jgi:hypothetical protein